jgi:hypothetical protein
MSFYDVHMGLSVLQMKNLSKFKNIRVSSKNLKNGPHHVRVTPAQYKNIMKNRKLNKGMVIQMRSDQQMRGSGFFSSIGDAFKTVSRGAVRGIKTIAPTVGKIGKFAWKNKKQIIDGVKTAVEIGKLVGAGKKKGGCCGCKGKGKGKKGYGVYVPGQGVYVPGGRITKRKPLTAQQRKHEELKRIMELY